MSENGKNDIYSRKKWPVKVTGWSGVSQTHFISKLKTCPYVRMLLIILPDVSGNSSDY